VFVICAEEYPTIGEAMRYKKFLLLVFVLTLFVVQQVQAGTILPSAKDPSQINFAPANAPLEHIWVWVLHLDDPSGRMAIPRTPCGYRVTQLLGVQR
jgi:hypothetical protein